MKDIRGFLCEPLLSSCMRALAITRRPRGAACCSQCARPGGATRTDRVGIG